MNTKYRTPILLIEDEASDVELIKAYLEDAAIKFELFHTETLYEGLEFVKKKHVDLVLLDLNLPDSNGFKTLTSFMEKAPKIPVVVVTNINNEIIGNQAVRAGAQDFLVKGQFDGKLLGRAVRYALHRSKTQLKLAETANELELHRARFLEAEKMAHLGTWEMDIVSNEMKWSDEVFRIFGFQPGVMIPTLSDYLVHVSLEDKKEVEAFFERAGKDGKLHHLEHRITIEGQNIRYVSIHGKVQFKDEGKIIIVGGLLDVTERKLNEQLIIEKNISTKTDKIKEEALSELGFHIRTPLSSIVNLLYLLENTRVSTQQNSYVGDLKTSVDDLSIAVNNLLNFSVMVSDNMKLEEEEFGLREFMQGNHNAVKIKADTAGLTLLFNLDSHAPEKIMSDPKKLTQILYNLIENAIRYTPEGGHIVVSVRVDEAKGSKTNLILEVADTGAGMSKSKVAALLQADKLLEVPADESSKKKRQLGVAIVAKLARTMGGDIQIQSREKEGTVFKVIVPVKRVRQSRFVKGDTPEVPLKVLLVEDHFLNQIATKKILTSWSDLITVDIAENGLLAIEKFKENGYDLILMDIQMPVMNGIDATRKIRAFSDVPIIALTANSTKQEQDKCFEIGMNDYLPKPFQPHDLYGKIMNLMSLVLN